MGRTILRKGGANQRYVADNQTGNIVDFLADDEQPVIPRKKVFWPEDFSLVFLKEFGFLAKLGLSANEWNVLAWLISKIEYENYVEFSQKEIAKDLELRQAHVSTYLKRLVSLQIITPCGRNGLKGKYRINSRVMWKGNTKLIPLRRTTEWKEHLEKLEEKRKKKEKELE